MTEAEAEKRRAERAGYPNNAINHPKRLAEMPVNRRLDDMEAWNHSTQVRYTLTYEKVGLRWTLLFGNGLSYTRRVEVREWVLKSRIFESCSDRASGVSTNLSYFCMYGSSGWASVMVFP